MISIRNGFAGFQMVLALGVFSQSKEEKKLDKLYDQITEAYSAKKNGQALELIAEAGQLIKESFDADPRLTLGLLGQKILIVERMGRLEELMQVLNEERDLIVQLAGQDNNLYLENQVNMARLHQQLANYQEAEKLFTELDPKYRRQFAGTLTLANFQRDHGNLLFYLGQLDKAKSVFEENLNYYLEHLSESSIQTSIGFNNLGVLALEQKEFNLARSYLQKAYDSRKAMGYEDESFAAICYNLGLVFLETRSLDSAEQRLREAINIRKKVNGESHAMYGASIGGLGRVMQAKKDYEGARKFYEESLKIVGDALGIRHPRYTQLLSRLATLLDEAGDFKGAFDYHQKTLDNVRFLIQHVFPGLSENEQSNYYYSIQYLIQRFYDHCLTSRSAESVGEMYDAQLMFKGLFGRTATAMATKISRSKNQQLIDAHTELANLQEEFTTWIKKGEKSKTDSLLVLIEQREKALSLLLSRELLAEAGKSWREVKGTLKPHEAALEIVRTDGGQYAAVGITAQAETPFLIEIGEAESLESGSLEKYRNAIKFKLTDNFSFQVFAEPLTSHASLLGIQKIYLSADGAYHLVNLGGMKDTKGSYLGDRIEFVRVTSTADLVRSGISDGQKSITIFGSPRFDLDDEQGEPLDGHWSRALQGTVLTPLPGTRDEAVNIDQMLKENFDVSLYLDVEATESAVKGVQAPDILHIATHGFFLKSNKADISEKNFLGLESLSDFEHPLLRSGLMLSGSQQTINQLDIGDEDGILTAQESSLLNLEGTRLAVLSACETGLGEVKNGEGVFGLQRALMLAGTQNLLMSLWQVDDEATQMLITNFYLSLSQGESIRTSLKNAQGVVREKYPHPYYWASFVHLGLD